MKKITLIVFVLSALVACKKSDSDMVLQLDTPFTIKVKQTAELEPDGLKITLLGITEDSRCPVNVECIWAGRLVAEFKVEKDGEGVVRSLSEDTSGDPAYSNEFEAFGHVVRLVEALPEPEIDKIKQSDYILKIEVE